MQIKLMLTSCLMASFFLSSCGYMLKPNKRKEVKEVSIGDPQAFELQDPDCDLGDDKPKFSKAVKIWMVDQANNLRQQSFDLSNVSRAGLESAAVSEALYSSEDVDSRSFFYAGKDRYLSKFKDHKALHALEQEHDNGIFKKISFCRPNGGYRAESIENAALAAFVAINEANKIHKGLTLGSDGKALNKIKLFVHPKLFARENDYVKEYHVDNAFWANFPSFQLIAVLPHSKEWEEARKLRFWETPGVFAHEYGHHIFHTYAPFAENPASEELYRINNGFNEGFADLVSYFSLSARRRLNPALMLSGESKSPNRDVTNSTISYMTMQGPIEYEKIYDSNIVSILGATETYLIDHVDSEGRFLQECHESGAIIAYVFNTLMNGYGYEKNPSKKMELLISWLVSLERQVILERHNGPQEHLEKSLRKMLTTLDHHGSKEGALELTPGKKKELIEELFPHYQRKWGNN
ncbi:MAG: hypothetical protein HRU09_13420 [Oligoflexales bacterium]|nr:hypothetical protein [Oligoflexales bacterium]